MKRRLIILIANVFILCGCQLTPRSLDSFPRSLHRLYFSPEKPYSLLSTHTKLLLQSMQVVLVKKHTQSPYSLIITQDEFSYNRADVMNANLPTTMNYKQTATIQIQNNRTLKIIASNDFQTTESLTLNANQMNTTNANEWMKQTLNRDITSLIYYWLISNQVRNKLHDENTVSH